MTGKDLIIYILEHDLVDEPIIDRYGHPAWLISIPMAAIKFGVGVETVKAWIKEDRIKYQTINDVYYIFADAEDPRKTK